MIPSGAMPLNEGYTYTERIGAEDHGRTVLDHLVRRYRHSSAETWAKRLAEGAVRIDGDRVDAGRLLRRGQVLSWARPPWEEPDAPESFAVLYEDTDLLVVDKPAGMPTLPGAGFLERTLLHRVGARAPGAAPVHRLGRFTSGLVLFARTPGARADLSRQWASREVVKRYRTLASGDPPWSEIRVTVPIGPVPHALLGTVHAFDPGGKAASSFVRVVERRGGAFLCDVVIETGRPHQIRIHLAAAGHPLRGDPLYASGGLPIPGTRAVPGDPGYLLHASGLTFRHPRTGSSVVVESPPPPELRAAAPRRRPGGRA